MIVMTDLFHMELKHLLHNLVVVHLKSIGLEEVVEEAAFHTAGGRVVTAVEDALVADYHKNLAAADDHVAVAVVAVAEEEGIEVAVEGILLLLLHLLHTKIH